MIIASTNLFTASPLTMSIVSQATYKGYHIYVSSTIIESEGATRYYYEVTLPPPQGSSVSGEYQVASQGGFTTEADATQAAKNKVDVLTEDLTGNSTPTPPPPNTQVVANKGNPLLFIVGILVVIVASVLYVTSKKKYRYWENEGGYKVHTYK